jgi:hypothetical protein
VSKDAEGFYVVFKNINYLREKRHLYKVIPKKHAKLLYS